MFDRFRAASSGQQIQIIAAGVCLIGVLLVAFWFSFLRTVYQPLFSDLRPADAATIIADLDQKKIPYRLADGGRTILVPGEMVDATRLGVMTGDMPLKGTVGFELFDKSDMGLTDFAQKINYQRALQGELERTIMTLDGVETARVHLSLGEDRLFRDDQVAPKASVTIRMTKGAVLSGSAAQGVKRLVAAAVPKLDVADVVILDEAGQVIGGVMQTTPFAKTVAPLQAEKRAVEEYYEAVIREAFARANLSEDTAVNVVAEIADANAAAPGAAGLPGWNPAARNFPLAVTLSPATPINAEARQSLLMLAAQTIASSTTQQDVIVFGVTPLASPPDPIDPVPAVPVHKILPLLAAPPALDDEHDLFVEGGFALLLVLIVFAGLSLLFRQLRGPRRLSKKRRADFTANLRKAIEERNGHAASSS